MSEPEDRTAASLLGGYVASPATTDEHEHVQVRGMVRRGEVVIARHGTFDAWPRPGADFADLTPFAARGAMLAAYREAGLDMVPTTEAVRRRAEQLAQVAAFVAEHAEAPARMLADVERAIVAWLQPAPEAPDAWAIVLEHIFASEAVFMRQMPRKTRAKEEGDRYAKAIERRAAFVEYLRSPARVRRILDELRRHAVRLPPALMRDDDRTIAHAADEIAGLRASQRGTHGPGVVTAWALAAKFAGAFGVPLPTKRSDATRKTTRRRGRNTGR